VHEDTATQTSRIAGAPNETKPDGDAPDNILQNRS